MRKCGEVFGEFILHIIGVATTSPTYRYNYISQPQSVVLQGARNAFYGNITNATHGDGIPKLHVFDIKIMECYVSGDAISYKEASKEDYTLSFDIGGVKAEDNTLQIELPVMIANPISVRFNVVLTKAGIYRIALRMDASNLLTSGIIYEFTIHVV